MSGKNSRKKAIKTYEDFMKFKINVNEFNNDYKAIMGGCGCSGRSFKKGGVLPTNLMDMPSFLNANLPKLKGGYDSFSLDVKPATSTVDSDEFNLFRDWLSPQAASMKTSSLLYSDLSQKSYSYPSTELSMQRTLV